MTTITRTIVSVTAILGCIAATTAYAEHGHGGFGRIERTLNSVQDHAHDTFAELRHNFDGSPCYRELAGHASDLYRTATRMKVVARNGGSLRQLHNDTHRLERLVANMQDEAHHLDPWRSRNLCHLLTCLEDLVEDLDEQVIALSNPRTYDDRGYTSGYGYGPSGISFGGRGFSVQFGR